jgi:hypothetical protein
VRSRFPTSGGLHFSINAHISSMIGQDNKHCGPVEQIFNLLSAKWTIANKNSGINIKLTI